MVLPLLLGGAGATAAGKLYEAFEKKKDKKKKKAYEAGKAAGMAAGMEQAGMENVGGGAGMSVNRKKGGKIKAKKKGGAPHNRLY